MQNFIFLVILLILFCSHNINAQQTCDCNERLRNLAWYYYTQNKFKESLDAMKQAIHYKEAESSDTDYFVLALAYTANDSLDQAFNALLIAVEKGLSRESFESDDFKPLRDKAGADRWDQVKKQYDGYYSQYKSTLNLEYRLAVEWLKGSDQRIRSSKDGLRQQDYVLFDSLNFAGLKVLFDNYGFPSMKAHGFNWDVIDVFMMHYSVESEDKYKEVISLLEKASAVCLCDKGDITVVTDRRRRWIEQKPQLFGMWNLWNEKGFFGAIEDIQAVDNRRFKYNLLRLKEQSEMEGRSLPKDYLSKPYPKDYFCGFSTDLK